jgi:hypothetical protein
MNYNPLRGKTTNRALDTATPKEFNLGITIEDVDTAIFNYMEKTILPRVSERGTDIKVPVLYANAERWKSIQKNGVYLDKRGKIQIPVLIFKRNSIEKDSTMPFMNRRLSYPTVKKYSQRNRYDKFSLLNNTAPEYETYNIVMPDYVTITYEVSIWTSFIEHMNHIIEQFQFAVDEYWGDKDKFKFYTKADSFSTETDLAAGSERIIRTTFNLTVNAYLLPKQFDGEPTTKLGSTVKRIFLTTETEFFNGVLTGDAKKIDSYPISDIGVSNFETDGFVTSSDEFINELDNIYLISGSVQFVEELENNIFITSGSFEP